jgi:signal transduction histidine kinase
LELGVIIDGVRGQITDAERLEGQHAALRRVATLVAQEAAPAEVFAAVAHEVAETLGVPLTAIVRYDGETATQVGLWGGENPFPVGTSWPIDEQSVSGMVWHTGEPARVDDYAKVPGGIAATLAQQAGIRSAVGVPIVVEGHRWGVMMALATGEESVPAGTELQLAEFTQLVATAIANAQAHDDLRMLLAEQAALRRVATLVARGSDSRALFEAVCAETGKLIGATSVNLARFTVDGFNLTMAGWSVRDTHVPTGTRLPLAPATINGVIQHTVAPARVDDYSNAPGELASIIRERGIRSEVGAPVIVEGAVWGALIAGTDSDEPLPVGTEARVARFAELTATAVANATNRSELIASRARIVAAGDHARQRIERNLHDGTQQRLVAIGLDLQAIQAKAVPNEELYQDLERVEREVRGVLEDVREISRGLHPPLLAQRGLAASLRSLARKSPLPVDLEVELPRQLPESVQIATHYVVSEALANAAKHAQAQHVRVLVRAWNGLVHATIEDDGKGGADLAAGSGLIGLVDRVEALGGRFSLESVPSMGTRISIELPLAGEARPRRSNSATQTAGGETQLAQIADASTLLAAVAAVAEGLYVVDARGRVRFLNSEAQHILGYDDERQLLGRPSHETIHYLRPDGSPFPASECPLLRPRVTGETIRVEEDWFVRQDGSFVLVAYSSAPVVLPDGRGAVVSFRERRV